MRLTRTKHPLRNVLPMLAAVFAALNLGQAQDPDADLIKESISVFDKEMKPIQEKLAAKSAASHQLRGLKIQLVNRLETADDNSLARVRREMQELSMQLQMLERLENVLADMDPDAIKNAIDESKQQQDALMQQLKTESQPLQDEAGELQQEYAHKNEELTAAIKNYFQKDGTGEFQDFKMKYGNANFVAALFTCSYDTAEKDSAFNITIQLRSQLNLPNREFQKLDDRHTIYQWSDNSLTLLVNGIQISAYDSSQNMGKEKIMEAVKHLIDLDGLAALKL